MKHIIENSNIGLACQKACVALSALLLSAVVTDANGAPAQYNGSLAPSQLPVAGIAKYVYPSNAAATPGKTVFMPDGESYLKLEDGGRKIVRYETATGKMIDTVLDTSHTRENSISGITDFSLSPEGSKLLVYGDSEPVYRRSMRAAYYVFEIKRNILRPLSKNFRMQQSPIFSPDGRMVAFVVDNNIYIKKTDYDSEVQVTTDGKRNEIINGIPDWTYEEEFGTDCSMTWAPDNSTLCFIRYDESKVPTFTFSLYEGWCEPKADYALYPGEFSYKYPVAGQPNSQVSVHSYDVETRKTKEIALPDPQIEYVPRISYGTSATAPLMVVTLNRAQNRMEIYAANPKSTVVKSILVEQAKGWLNPAAYENISFGNDGFVVFSERSGWNHLYKYSYNGQLLRQITSGDYEVTAFYGEDASGFSYFQSEPCTVSTSSNPRNALNRVLYKVDRQGKKFENLSETEGWGSAEFSPLMNYYVVNYSNASTPPVYTLYNAKGKRQRVIEDNGDYAARYAGCAAKEYFTMQSDGTTLNGYIIKPVDFNPSRKYPVIMWQYSGPGSQEVTNRWKMDWDYFAATQGFVVVCVDGRGTGGRGTAFRDVVYKRLGRFETIDQINAASYATSLPFVDGDRIGISGWSYGGYETLMAVTSSDRRFKAAVAIAPVTSWRYYDTVYTERFMLTPQENGDAYDEGAPVNRADKMNCRLLLMSGTADDNVHLSNSIEFAGKLQQAGRYCDMFLFPGMNHSINGCDARALVYGRMIEYFKANL